MASGSNFQHATAQGLADFEARERAHCEAEERNRLEAEERARHEAEEHNCCKSLQSNYSLY